MSAWIEPLVAISPFLLMSWLSWRDRRAAKALYDEAIRMANESIAERQLVRESMALWNYGAYQEAIEILEGSGISVKGARSQ